MTDHSTALKGAMQIDGALGGRSGRQHQAEWPSARRGSPVDLDLEVAAAGNSKRRFQAKLRHDGPTLGLQQSIEDILITPGQAVPHQSRPLGAAETSFFLYPRAWTGPRAKPRDGAVSRLAGIEQNLKI